MRSFWFDPYFWVHLAGAAVVPLSLELCLLGLAAGNPFLPLWLEFLLIAALGAGPILWMQWQRPFCIYSLMFLSVKPSELNESQRKALRRFKAPVGKGLSLATAALLLFVLWQLYKLAPLAAESASIVPWGHVGGLLLATIAFLASNLFLQVPVSVAQVILTSEAAFAATEPYPATSVARDFTLFGIRVKQILPPLLAEPEKPKPTKLPQPAPKQVSDKPETIPEPPVTVPIAVSSEPETTAETPNETGTARIEVTESPEVAASIVAEEIADGEIPAEELIPEEVVMSASESGQTAEVSQETEELDEDWGDLEDELSIGSPTAEAPPSEVIEAEVVETFDVVGEVENLQVEVTIVEFESDASLLKNSTELDALEPETWNEEPGAEEPIVEDVSEEAAIDLEQLDEAEATPTVNLEDVSEEAAIDVEMDVDVADVSEVEVSEVEVSEVQVAAIDVPERSNAVDVAIDEETTNWDDDDESWET